MKKTTVTLEVLVKVDIYLPEGENQTWKVASVHLPNHQTVQKVLDNKHFEKAHLDQYGEFRHYK